MNNIKQFFTTHFYIIVPIVSFFFWPLLLIYIYGFNYEPVDFITYYTAGKYIFINPELIYTIELMEPRPGYYYLPSFVCAFFFLSLFDYEVSKWIFFIILIIIFLLSIIELNKILILKDIDDKFTRFLILMVFSHGLRILQMFIHLQVKWITMFLIILFIRREIERRKSREEYFNFKFFFIQINILFFAISMNPPLIFIVFIYIFNNVRLNSMFEKNQLYKYLLSIIAFVWQNIMFLIFPQMLLQYLTRASNYPFGRASNIYAHTAQDVINNRTVFSKCSLTIIMQLLYLQSVLGLISIISVIFITVLLCLKRDLLIEDKLGYFMLFSLFLNIFFIKTRNLSIVVPCIILLLINSKKIQGIDNSKNLKSLIDYFRNNNLFILGLISIIFINFYPEMHLLLRVIPMLKIIPVPILALAWTFIYIYILIIVIFIRKKGIKKVNGEIE